MADWHARFARSPLSFTDLILPWESLTSDWTAGDSLTLWPEHQSAEGRICKEGGSEKAKYATIEDRKLVSRRAAAGVELVVP